MNALEFSFILSVVVAMLSSFVPFTMDIFAFPLSTVLIIIGKSILSGLAFLLVMKSLQENDISSALPLLGLTPAVTALVSLIILQEKITEFEWIGVGLIIAGTTLLEKRPSTDSLQSVKIYFTSKKYYYVFGAVGLFSFSSVIDKFLMSSIKVNPFIVLFYQHIVYVFILSMMMFSKKISINTIIQKGKEEFPSIIVVALLTLAYRYTQLEATKLAPVALVLAVKRTSILYASFFGGKLFSEDRLTIKLIGAVLIVVAGFIILRNVG